MEQVLLRKEIWIYQPQVLLEEVIMELYEWDEYSKLKKCKLFNEASNSRLLTIAKKSRWKNMQQQMGMVDESLQSCSIFLNQRFLTLLTLLQCSIHSSKRITKPQIFSLPWEKSKVYQDKALNLQVVIFSRMKFGKRVQNQSEEKLEDFLIIKEQYFLCVWNKMQYRFDFAMHKCFQA